MRKTVLIGILAWASISAAAAGVIDDRQAIMKKFGGAARILSGIARGTTPYDSATTAAQLQILSAGAEEVGALFPVGLDKDTDAAKTLARPAVWSDSGGFAAALAKFTADVQKAEATQDAAGFTVAYNAVAADCAACHLTYRVPLPPAIPPPGAAAGTVPPQPGAQ